MVIRMRRIKIGGAVDIASILLLASCSMGMVAQAPNPQNALHVTVDHDGSYAIGIQGKDLYALKAGIAAEVDGRWLHAADYPKHSIEHSSVTGFLGAATDWQVTCSGLSGQPELIYRLRAYANQPFADIQVTVRNTTAKPIHVEAIRSVEATQEPILNLDGPAAENRVLSDSYSEDGPAVKIRDLADAEQQMHRAVGSQLIYNRRSHESLFLGALTSNRFITILRLHLSNSTGNSPRLLTYQVDSTGTTEIEKDYSLQHAPAVDQIQLNLPVTPGDELSSERVLFSVSKDYHKQLETYGSLIRDIHHARTSAPPLMGWWSWTAYYFGLNSGTALTNAKWEAEHLKSLGYNVFHIDEGYQYARGEYTTANATLFPDGLAPVYYQVHGLGLVPGIWTAPFEVSERSWVYHDHPDWLVKNARGTPIPVKTVVDHKDQLYILDTTNPSAQDYLRKAYSTLVRKWGIRYIKLDFMDDSAIEGFHYQPNVTAMEAQRIGLQIIRDTVGDNVYLDKDGSVMMNPVGLVDYGRISQDTGHTFLASKEAEPGIAARYYMNHNFFVADPDAFTVSEQTIADQAWHESKIPLTLDEAKVSIALAAISGGALEIGDNLPSLSKEPERLALIENPDLIDMVRLGEASIPVDLMSYSAQDQQPSIFLLKEDLRQSILAVFNWTDKPREHTINLSSIGLPVSGRYVVTDVLENQPVLVRPSTALMIQQPPHSVRVLKIIDTRIPASAPEVKIAGPSDGDTGETITFSAQNNGEDPVLSYIWNFGDGVTSEGGKVQHAYTEPGVYTVRLKATDLDGLNVRRSFKVHISGRISTTFDPANIKRYH